MKLGGQKQKFLVRIHVEQYVDATDTRAAAAQTMHDLTGDHLAAFRLCSICAVEATPSGNLRKNGEFKYFNIEELK